MKSLSNNHRKALIIDTKSREMLLDDDTTFVADECPNGEERMNHSFKSSDSAMSENEIEGTKTTDDPLMNESSRDSSNITLKITLDHYPVEKMVEQLDNEIKGDEVTEAKPVGKPYPCYICGKEFSRKSSLKCHIDMHMEGQIIRAPKNGVPVPGAVKSEPTAAVNGASAATSNGVADDTKTYKCEQCDRTFDTKRGLYRHIGHHKSRPSYPTEDVGSDIDLTLDDETDEKVTVSGGGEFVCSQCGKEFKTSRAVNIHASHIHGKRVSAEEEYDEVEVVEVEDDDEDETPAYVCAVCRKSFTSQRARSVHAAHAHKNNGTLESYASENSIEDMDDPFQCPLCKKYFKNSRALNIHRAHQHKSDQEESEKSDSEDEVQVLEFACTVCDRMFTTRRARSIHAKIHERGGVENDADRRESTDEPLECEVCGRKFNSTSAYQLHAEGVCGSAQIVDGTYVFVCQLCPKTYMHPNSMSRHRTWHRNAAAEDVSEEEEVEEEEEDEQEQDEEVSEEEEASDKEEIIWAHDLEKKFQCQYCAKCFPNKQAYAGHMKAHNPANQSGARPIIGVRNRPVLIKGEKVYKCPYCTRTFDNCNGYAGHMKSHRDVRERVPNTTVDSSSEPEHTSSSDDDDEVDQVKMFSCRFCNKKFSSPKQLGGHVKLHRAETNARSSFVSCPTIEDKVYKCDACTKTFTYMSELRRHTSSKCRGKRSFHAGKLRDQFKCPYCEQKFLLKCHLDKHLKLRCNVNDLGSESNEDEAPVNGDGSEAVEQVDRRTSAAADDDDADDEQPPAKRVRKSTYLDSTYEYEPVGRTRNKAAQALRKELLDAVKNDENANMEDDYYMEPDPEIPASEHFVITNSNGDQECMVFEQYNDSGYQCNECEERFRDKLQMMVHMSFHFNSGFANNGRGAIIAAPILLIAPHKCHFCEERFVNRNYRRRHLRKQHGGDIMQCDVCQKLFLCKATLRRHCKQHLIATRYNCEYCLKSFTSKWFLRRHTTRQCDKKLALEEHNQSAHMAALSMLEHSDQSDSSADLPPRFDELVYSEGAALYEEETIDLKDDENEYFSCNS